MLNGVLDNFVLPDGAAEAIAASNTKMSKLTDGVDMMISGHDEGTPFIFETITELNEKRSKAAHYSVFDEVEIIKWFSDSRSSPTCRVRHLAPEQLYFDDLTGQITGRYAEAYKRFKAGVQATGLKLSKWGEMSDGEVASLNAAHIYTVEQFAEIPANKVLAKFPPEYGDAHQKAIHYINGKTNRMEADKQASEILSLSQQNSKLQDQLDAMRAQMEKLAEGVSKKGKRGRPKKEAVDMSEIENDPLLSKS